MTKVKRRRFTSTFIEQLITHLHATSWILGDMNAKISSTHTKFVHDKRTNENGTRMIEAACESINMASTLIHEQRRLLTFIVFFVFNDF